MADQSPPEAPTTDDHVRVLSKRMRLDPAARREISLILGAEGCADLHELAALAETRGGLVTGPELVAILAEQYVEIDETAEATEQWYADNLRPEIMPELPRS